MTSARRLFVTSAVIFASCSSSSAGPPLPPSPPVVVVTMRDHRFEHTAAVPAGRVVFKVRNAGRAPHRLTLFPLAEDVPPIEAQLKGGERRSAPRFAGVPTRPPGTAGMFAVDLAPGTRYALVCFVQGPDGKSHALQGMASELRTAGPLAEPAPEPAEPGETTTIAPPTSGPFPAPTEE